MNSSSASRWTGTNDPTSIRATNAPCRRSLVREAGPSPRSSPRPARSSSAARISRRTGSMADPASAPSSPQCSRHIAPAGVRSRLRPKPSVARSTADLDEATPGDLSPPSLEAAARGMSRVFDTEHGGFGSQPKFPHPTAITFLAAPLVRYPTRRVSGRSSTELSRGWVVAAYTTSSAVDSIVTASMHSGSFRTSRRCRTTTPSC